MWALASISGVSSGGNTIVENRVAANGGNGIQTLVRDSGGLIADNAVVNNGGSGIEFWDSVSHLVGNNVSGNAGYGIEVRERICEFHRSYVVAGNTANRNGLLGIKTRRFDCLVPIGDGSGNLAKHNGDPLECDGLGLTCDRNLGQARKRADVSLSQLPTHPA